MDVVPPIQSTGCGSPVKTCFPSFRAASGPWRAGAFAPALCLLLGALDAPAVTTVFFNSAQATTLVSTNATSDTLQSEGYLFTYTRDKLFTGGTSTIIGRPVRVDLPTGLEAQYVTAGPNPAKASITVRRVDGAVFDLPAFSVRLLANPGAGRAIEIVPFLNGEEPLNDPLPFDVSSGYYGSTQSFDATTPAHIGSTAALTNYDAYAITLTLDYALTAITLVDASIPPPVLDIQRLNGGGFDLSWPEQAAGYALESAPDLATPAWGPVTNVVHSGGGLFSVQMHPTAHPCFFRLRKP